MSCIANTLSLLTANPAVGEYEPGRELRGTEQVPLLHEGRIGTSYWWDRRAWARAFWPRPGLLRHPGRPHRAFHPRLRLLQEHGSSPSRQLAGSRFPVFPIPRPACSSWTTSVCSGSPHSSRLTCTSSSSTAIGSPASPSPATGPWTNSSASSTIPSWATALQTA